MCKNQRLQIDTTMVEHTIIITQLPSRKSCKLCKKSTSSPQRETSRFRTD